jgi:hypothetical protein
VIKFVSDLCWFSMYAYLNFLLQANYAHGEVYWIQQYVIKFVGDLRQVGGMERIYIGYCLLSNPFHLFMNKICFK